jgi:hypothetical protein
VEQRRAEAVRLAHELLAELTLCVPFYRNPLMLARQIEEWNKYPDWVRVILVDDCSPEPALPIVKRLASAETLKRLEVYRTDIDVKWAREFCRNLMAKVATTDWLLMLDIDHVAPVESLELLKGIPLPPKRWFRFRRIRIGKADETRKKDFQKTRLPDDAERGEVHEHIDSYLTRAKHYWKAGGYNEKFCGVLGGGNEFLRRFEALYPVEVISGDVFLHVYTRSVINDASDLHCSRDTKPGKDLWRAIQKAGWQPPTEWLTLPWSRVL